MTTVDEDQQEVVVDEPGKASSSASLRCSNRRRIKPAPLRWKTASCLEVYRETISKSFLSASRMRAWTCLTAARPAVSCGAATGAASRHPQSQRHHRGSKTTSGERIADSVAAFGGSWTFIITVRRCSGRLHNDQCDPRQDRHGIRIRLSCSTCFSPCSPPSRRR